MSTERHVVMLIDDDEIYLSMGREMLEDKYVVYPVVSGEQAFILLERVIPDLILLDIEMPGMDGYAVMKRLKKGELTKDIPVIFLTAQTEPGYEFDGLSLGAIDYITKPFAPLLLIQRIENHLLISSQKKELLQYNQSLQHVVKEQSKEIRKLVNIITNTVSELVEFRDKMIGEHIERIQEYMRTMVEAMRKQGLYRDEIDGLDTEDFINAAKMHDIGKICVSEAILNKPGKVTAGEFDEIKKHPAHGSKIIDRMRQITDKHTILDYAGVFSKSHHERWDGSGYPEGRKGQEIPLAGRLMALIDVYDALIAPRPYKQPMSANNAAEEIIRGSGTAFDPALIDIFKMVAGKFAAIAECSDEPA